jgi:hypothetical protein
MTEIVCVSRVLGILVSVPNAPVDEKNSGAFSCNRAIPLSLGGSSGDYVPSLGGVLRGASATFLAEA